MSFKEIPKSSPQEVIKNTLKRIDDSLLNSQDNIETSKTKKYGKGQPPRKIIPPDSKNQLPQKQTKSTQILYNPITFVISIFIVLVFIYLVLTKG